jgi:hypothetical protein
MNDSTVAQEKNMKTLLSGKWNQAARIAVAAVLVCVSQAGWAEDKPAATPEAPLAIQGAQTDDLFEQYVSLAHLGSAWRNLDAAAMTDSALQFAEAERVLLRSHGSIKASQVFDLAIRVATEKGDKASLARLAKSLERSGDKDRLAQVNLAMQAAGTSRAVDPVLIDGDVNIRSTIQDVEAEIQSAKIAGSKDHLIAIEQTLADESISETQRTALKRRIKETFDSLGDDTGEESAVAVLDKMSGVVRPLAEIKEPTGDQFVMPDYSGSELSIKEQTAIFLQESKVFGNQSGELTLGMDDPGNVLASLSKQATRSVYTGWTDQKPNGGSEEYAYSAYGVGSIFQYVNAPTTYSNRNCGQAAMATVLNYHQNKIYKNKKTLPQDLERVYPPDVLFGAGGTSNFRMQSMGNNYGLSTYQCFGQSDMEKWVRAGYPCCLLVDCGKAGWKNSDGSEKWGLHWSVCYAYDRNNYWLTNWPGSAKVPKSKLIGNGGWVGGLFILAKPK